MTRDYDINIVNLVGSRLAQETDHAWEGVSRLS